MHPWITEFRLASPGGDGRYASVDGAAGACLGGLPLLDRSPLGGWLPRPRAALESALSDRYGERVDLTSRMPALMAVSKALTEGDLARAHIALVHARFPPLPERVATVDKDHDAGLTKQAGYLTQPRIPAGALDAKPGTWTSAGAGGAGAATLDAALTVARMVGGRLSFVGALLIPGNIGQTRSGRIPGTDVDYGYAEGQLTLTTGDGEGRTRLVYDGIGDLDGQYRTPDGTPFARVGPDGLALEPGTIAAMAGDQPSDAPRDKPRSGNPKAARPYQENPDQLRDRDPAEVEAELDEALVEKGGWTKSPSKDGNGIRYNDGKGGGIIINNGYPEGLANGGGDDVHRGPYIKIQPGGIRIPLARGQKTGGA